MECKPGELNFKTWNLDAFGATGPARTFIASLGEWLAKEISEQLQEEAYAELFDDRIRFELQVGDENNQPFTWTFKVAEVVDMIEYWLDDENGKDAAKIARTLRQQADRIDKWTGIDTTPSVAP